MYRVPEDAPSTNFIARFYRERLAAREWVSIELSAVNWDTVSVEQIWSDAERNAGHAGLVMKELLRMADEDGIAMRLAVHPLAHNLEGNSSYSEAEIDRLHELNDKGLNERELLAWYMRLGFTPDPGQDLDDSPVMNRAAVPLSVPAFGSP